MKTERPFRRWAVAACLSLLMVCQTWATKPLQQPQSVDADAGAIALPARDAAVTPVGCCDGGCCDAKGCAASGCEGNCGCRGCSKAVCCPKKVTTEVKQHCWKVKSELVCIPGFKFECNWRKNRWGQGGCDCGDACGGGCHACGTPTCGRVRSIRVLEKQEYTCEECGYEWSVKCVRSGNPRSRCGSCPACGASGCCASTEAPVESTQVQLTSGTEARTAGNEAAAAPSWTSRCIEWWK